MAYLLWFGIVALVFALMHYFTELSTRQKGLITLFVTLFVIGAIAYNIQSDRERSRVIAIELQYRQGKTILCQGIDVNNSTFSYSDGTQSFIGNKGTAHEQQILNVRECQ
jgi:hypothetical protein